MIEIDETPTLKVVKSKNIADWTVHDKDQVQEVNLGTIEKPHNVQICKIYIPNTW